MRELRKSLIEMGRTVRPVIMGQGCPWRSTVKVCGEGGHTGKEFLQLVPGGLPGGGDSASNLSTPAPLLCSLGLVFSPFPWGLGKSLAPEPEL